MTQRISRETQTDKQTDRQTDKQADQETDGSRKVLKVSPFL